MKSQICGSMTIRVHNWSFKNCLLRRTSFLLGALLATTANAQILQIEGSSLTSYIVASDTPVQGVRPRFDQRGVFIDGKVRMGSSFGWALNGNPLDASVGTTRLGEITLATGSFDTSDVDLALPAVGVHWVVGRSYNGRQIASTTPQDSNGYQGRNWFQSSQPELRFYDADSNSGTRQATDMVYIVYGAERYIEFKRTAANVDTFRGVNGAAGVVLYSSTDDTFTYTDQRGTQIVLNGGDNTLSGYGKWQLWKMTDAAGNVTFVGSTTKSSAIASGYDSSGRILYAYDASDRRYSYTYTTIDSVVRLTRVKAETKTSGTWASPSGTAEVGRVDYDYYQTGDHAHGDDGNLKLVTLTTPLSDPTQSLIQRKYYRYYQGTYNSSTNPGHPNHIMMVVGFEGTRSYDWLDSNLTNASFNGSGISDSTMRDYSDVYLEYDSSDRVKTAISNGECGCSGGANGTYAITYDNASSYSTYVGNTSYDNSWATDRTLSQRTMTVSSVDVGLPTIDSTNKYPDGVTGEQTSYTYVYYSSTATNPLYLAVKSVVITNPAVTTGNNGSNSATTTALYLNQDGLQAFSKDGNGVLTYNEYNSYGQRIKNIRDPKSSSGETAMDTAADSSHFNLTLPAGGLHYLTSYSYDPQGRFSTVTAPDGRVSVKWYTILLDGRMVSLDIPRRTTGGSTTYFGPASYTVSNHAGKEELDGLIGIADAGTTTALTSWIDSTDSDPITALDGSVGSLRRMRTTLYTAMAHQATESRNYFLIPASGSGSSGTNFDSTTYGYDDMGRNWRVVDPTGTISRSVFDFAGRKIENWSGLNDHSFTGGSGGGSDDMTKTAAFEYDVLSHETKRTLDPDGNWVTTTDQRVTERNYDDRGRAIYTKNPQAPHPLYKYDNLDRLVAVGMYSATTGTLNRLVDTVSYGTYGGSTFERRPSGSWLSAPSRSDTALRTTTTYNTDGTVKEVTDPRGIIAHTDYDDAGRVVKQIANYDDGAPGGGTLDDKDRTIKYEYTNGLRTKYIADLTGSGNDQETVYSYGTVKGTVGSGSPVQSSIASGRLLHHVTYPDSGGASDVVTSAYNALGEQIWTKDQSGNVMETDLDTGGRLSHKKVTTLISGFDGAVRRISMAYLNNGRIDSVTQYDNATPGSGSATDQVQYTYDGWGNTTKFEQDVDGIIGAGGRAAFNVQNAYSVVNSGNGRYTLKRTSQTLPGSFTVTYDYSSASNSLAADISRVSGMTYNGGSKVTYAYAGVSQLVRTSLLEPGDDNNLTDNPSWTSVPGYGNLDRFNRVTSSRWTNTNSVDYHRVDLTYDRNSNITSGDDTVLTAGLDAAAQWDVKYTMDDLNRVVEAEEGELGGGSISNGARDERWIASGGGAGLSPTGTWIHHRLDLDGNNNFSGTNELDETSTFNKANEQLTRQPTTSVSPTYSPVYDDVGNQTDDGRDYTYKYDAFGRLKEVHNRTTPFALVAEYKYNGLNYRTAWHYDVTRSGGGAPDGTVDSNDPWYYFAYDEQWRSVATFRGTDSDPKERTIYHNAGLDGKGSSNYIDAIVLTDRDLTNGWSGSADGTLEVRNYINQNWRGDVSVVTDSSGVIQERVKYSAYGVPFCIASGDFNCDGTVDFIDYLDFVDNYSANDNRADVNFDGVVNATDNTVYTAWNAAQSGDAAGRGVLSRSAMGNRFGYAAYQWDTAIAGSPVLGCKWHVRNRVFDSERGTWLRRDPLGYHDGEDLYEYVMSRPIESKDPLGLQAIRCMSASCGGEVGSDNSDLNLTEICKNWCASKRQEATNDCEQEYLDCRNNGGLDISCSFWRDFCLEPVGDCAANCTALCTNTPLPSPRTYCDPSRWIPPRDILPPGDPPAQRLCEGRVNSRYNRFQEDRKHNLADCLRHLPRGVGEEAARRKCERQSEEDRQNLETHRDKELRDCKGHG